MILMPVLHQPRFRKSNCILLLDTARIVVVYKQAGQEQDQYDETSSAQAPSFSLAEQRSLPGLHCACQARSGHILGRELRTMTQR